MPDLPWDERPDDVLCVGREEVLADVLAVVDPARSGAVVLTGEAGIGKSTLVAAVLRSLSARGVRVVFGSGDPVEMQLPFAVLRDVLLPLYAEFSAELPSPQRRALARALLVEEDEVGEEPAGQAVSVATAGVLAAAGTAGPLVIVLDDVQWVDPSSAQALRYALRRRHAGQFGVMMAHRAGHEDPVVGGLSASSEVSRMEVRPLSLGAIQVILAERLGVHLWSPT